METKFAAIPVAKRCTKCGEVKPIEMFEARKGSITGKGPRCKVCKNISNRAYYAKNPERQHEISKKYRDSNKEKVKEAQSKHRLANQEKIKERKKKYQEENKDKLKEYYKNYRAENREKVHIASRSWHLANAEKVYERQRKYRKENPDNGIVNSNNLRARKLGVSGKITENEWKLLKEKFAYTCPCCGEKEPFIKLTIDHIVPMSLGGCNTIDNLQCLCGSCNSSKGKNIANYKIVVNQVTL